MDFQQKKAHQQQLAIKDAIFLAIVFAGIQHYTGHICIALSTVSALIYVRSK